MKCVCVIIFIIMVWIGIIEIRAGWKSGAVLVVRFFAVSYLTLRRDLNIHECIIEPSI